MKARGRFQCEALVQAFKVVLTFSLQTDGCLLVAGFNFVVPQLKYSVWLALITYQFICLVLNNNVPGAVPLSSCSERM